MNSFKSADYENCAYPVILIDSDLEVAYKNDAAKILDVKPRVKTSITKYLDLVNIEKLRGAIEEREFRIIELDAVSPLKRCVAQADGKNITPLIFYDAVNYLKDGDAKTEEIISEYNRRRKTSGNKINQDNQDDRDNQDNSGGFFYSHNNHNSHNSHKNNIKLIRINEHFRKHMINLSAASKEKFRIYCDVGEFFGKFASVVSQYVSSFGYKINFNIEDKMFFYMLNEEDLLLINFIMAAFAFRHAVYTKVNVSFHGEYHTGVLRYEFTAGNDFPRTRKHKNIFAKDCDDEMSDTEYIEYLDLNLAALAAKNNDLTLRVYYDGDDESKILMDLIFGGNPPEMKSPFIDIDSDGGLRNLRNYITADDIKEWVEIEFSDVF